MRKEYIQTPVTEKDYGKDFCSQGPLYLLIFNINRPFDCSIKTLIFSVNNFSGSSNFG